MPETIKPMTAAELKRLAIATYGSRWKYIVRDEMKVSREMLWRYEVGETPISDDLSDRFRKLFRKEIKKRQEQLAKLLLAL